MRNRLRISKLRWMEKKGSSDITRTRSSTVTSPSQGTTVQDRWSPVFHPVPVVVPLEAMQAEQGITAQTPRSKTNQLIRDSGLNPRKVPAGIKKKLIYANVVEDELQTAAKKSDQHKEVLTEPLTPSPDVFVKSYQTEEAVKGLVDKVTATEVTVQQWQKVLDARDDKRRVKVVSTDMPLSEFKDKFVQDFDNFSEHNARAKTQYTEATPAERKPAR